jgi:hypothetical protein
LSDHGLSDGSPMTNLGKLLLSYQLQFEVDAKVIAKEIGIIESLLTRIKQGHMPDAKNFARIIVWLTQEEN